MLSASSLGDQPCSYRFCDSRCFSGTQVVKALLEGGANVDQTYPVYLAAYIGVTSLFIAAHNGHPEVFSAHTRACVHARVHAHARAQAHAGMHAHTGAHSRAHASTHACTRACTSGFFLPQIAMATVRLCGYVRFSGDQSPAGGRRKSRPALFCCTPLFVAAGGAQVIMTMMTLLEADGGACRG